MTHVYNCQSGISLGMSRQILGVKASTAELPVPSFSLTPTPVSPTHSLASGHHLSHHSFSFVLWTYPSEPSNNNARDHGDSLTPQLQPELTAAPTGLPLPCLPSSTSSSKLQPKQLFS